MQQIITEITNDIKSIQTDLTLLEETNFDSRNNAIDFLDFHVIERIEAIPEDQEFQTELDQLKTQAISLKNCLKEVDVKLFAELRNELCGTDARPLKSILQKYLGNDVFNSDQAIKIGYDNADIFINGLLTDLIFDADVRHPQPEMVYYQQTPARVIFQLATQANFKPSDIFFDLGSGLGVVAMLMNLLTGITTKGIEYERTYVDYANTCAARLNLKTVAFVNADARHADYTSGTIFFLYTPFTGSILADVLALIKSESISRQIRIFTYGPCSAIVANEPWLQCGNTKNFDDYQLYQFKSNTV